MDSVAAAAHSFSTMFPMMPGDDLSHNLILRALENIDTSSMSRGAASELIDWLNYNSPISPMNIHQTLSSFDAPQQPNNHPQYDQYPPQPPLFDSFIMPATTYPSIEESYSFMQTPTFYMPQEQLNYGFIPTYYPMHQYDAYVPSSAVGYQVPVGYVDEAAIIFVPGHDQAFDYEDLIELQEQIGRVNVGLTEENISKNLKTSLVPAANDLKQGEEEGEVCAVCQDDYKVNDTIGSLECGHRYHANCIKQWLLHKNVCPICKATALVL